MAAMMAATMVEVKAHVTVVLKADSKDCMKVGRKAAPMVL